MSDESANAPIKPDPQSIEGLFLAALGHSSPEVREAFLSEACGEDAERRKRIEALLRAYDDAGSFLEHSPVSSQLSDSFNLEFLTPSDDPGLIGTLGPYEVFEVLGRGGMGIVFRARDPKLNRIVAIKVLAPELAANPNARRRFLREAQAAAAISHPHVVTIHAVDEGDTASGGRQSPVSETSATGTGGLHPPLALPYLVMECIVGQTLQQKLDKQGSLRLTETLRIGHQLACGLAAAHKQGLIHRDIKPANILLENGVERVKITDFGLARAADDVSITRTGEVSGTPQYMSPEQATGDPVDHRSDLFSLGCVLYAMCTGRSPFRATTLAAAIRRVCDDTPRAITELNPETPAWLIAIIDQLLAKNPVDRIQSADEVASLLNDHLAGIQVSPRPAKRTNSPRSPETQRHTECSQETSASWLGVTPERDRLAMVLTICGFFTLAATTFWAVAGTNGLVPEPPFDQRHSLLNPLWMMALLSGVLLVSGITLGRYLLRPFPELFRAITGPPPPPRGEQPSSAAPQSLHTWGRQSMWAGLLFIALPWLPIFYGLIVGDGDPMQVGGSFVPTGLGFGLLAVIAGWVTKLVAHSTEGPDKVSRLSLWNVFGLGLLVCITLAVLAFLVRSKSRDEIAAERERLLNEAQSVSIANPSVSVPALRDHAESQHDHEELHSLPIFGQDPPHFVETADPPQGAVIIEFESPGLLVRFNTPEDQDGVGVQPSQGPRQWSIVKDGTYHLAADTYDVVVFDKWAGWKLGDQDPHIIPEPLTVKAGDFSPLRVRRDFQLLADAHPDWSTSGFFHFCWGREWHKMRTNRKVLVPVVYDLNRPQAKVVQALLLAKASDNPEVNAFRLLRQAEDNKFTLDDVADRAEVEGAEDLAAIFNEGLHPAWSKLIVEGNSPGYYRLSELTGVADERTASVLPPTRSPNSEQAPFSVAPAANQPSTSPRQLANSDRTGTLTIDIQDDGLLVALRRKSGFGGVIAESELQLTDFGERSLELHTGEYDVMIRDRLFGYELKRRRQTLILGDQGAELVVQREMGGHAARDRTIGMSEAFWLDDGVPNSNTFFWDGKRYAFESYVDKLTVWLLWNALGQANTQLDEQTLLKSLLEFRFGRSDDDLFDDPLPTTLEEAIQKANYKRNPLPDGKPVWNNLVIPGETAGTYRLAPLERGTLRVTSVSDGMRVVVTPVEKDPRFSSRVITSATELQVPPGEYSCKVYDTYVGWDEWGTGGGFGKQSNFVREESIAVLDSQTHVLNAERRITDYLDPPKPTPESDTIRFKWFPPAYTPGFGGFGGNIDGIHYVTPPQQAVFLKLLRAFANGKPEVPQSELVEGIEVDISSHPDVWTAIFPPRNGGPGEEWKTIIIPGETEGTWRLKPPPEGAFGERVNEGEAESAVDETGPPPPPMPEQELPPGEKLSAHETSRWHLAAVDRGRPARRLEATATLLVKATRKSGSADPKMRPA